MKPVKHYVSNPYYASIIYGDKKFKSTPQMFSAGGRGQLGTRLRYH